MTKTTSKIKIINSVLKPVRRLAPRIKPRLKPLNDIKQTNRANTGSWDAIGSDPQFLCQFQFLSPHTGWYQIELDIRSTEPSDVAKFYLDFGEGFSEADVVSIPYTRGVAAIRMMKFSRNASAIRFDPQTSPGDFTIARLALTPVTFKTAESRMLRLLTGRKTAVLHETVSGARAALQGIAAEQNASYEQVLVRHYSSLFNAPAVNNSYQDWIDITETALRPTELDVADLNARDERPLLSIIMPTCNTNSVWLRQTIKSVQEQSYGHWQLCIADDASTQQDTLDTLMEIAAADSRINLIQQTSRAGIAENTNAALRVAKGDFCLFLDHDDLLAENALFEVAKVIVSDADVKLIYSDEDKIDESGARVEPHFKPDWNPDLLLSQNYICHLTAIRRSVLDEVGLCRPAYDGAQDHDLLLRVASVIERHNVKHISQILYHWRMAPDSTAANASSKDYSTASGVAAVTEYMKSKGELATVTAGSFPNTYRVQRNIPEPQPLVSIIIPTRDQLDILKQCIDSVLDKTDYSNYEIIVVDNRSEQQETLNYFEQLQDVDRVRVLAYDKEFNYSAINNYAVAQANGALITLLNNDIEVISPEWLTEMVSHAIRPNVGCVGAKLLYKNNMVQHAGVILGIGGVAGHSHKYFDADSPGYFSRLHLTQNMTAVTAACLTVEKEIYLAAGGLNEHELKVAFNDVDFCLRVNGLGFDNLWTPYALLYHHESISRGQEDTSEKQARFNKEAQFMLQRWGSKLLADPAYNRNLSRSREDFSLAA